MKPLCMIVLLGTTLVCRAEEKPALERAGENLPIVKMPLAKIVAKRKSLEAPLLETVYRPNTDVAIEGEFQVVDAKDFDPSFRISVRFSVKEKNGPGWETVCAHRGGRPMKIKEGHYRYRSVITTPVTPGTYYVHVYDHEQWCMSLARVEVDEDAD
jgi:hypothetical protein